eukprot:4529718-Prymnesium_polylepis.1
MQPHVCVENPSDLPRGGEWRTRDELLQRLDTIEAYGSHAKYAIWYDDYDNDDHYADESSAAEIRQLIEDGVFAQAWYVCFAEPVAAALLAQGRAPGLS